MNIHLDPHEMEIVRKKATEFKEKTGKEYSLKYIGLLLKEQYMKRFQHDIDKVMEIKTREAQDSSAETGDF